MALRIRRRDLMLGLLSAALWPAKARAAAEIDLVTYHDQPPLAIEAGAGLSFDLAHYLTTRFGSETAFQTILVPRRRLDLRLEDPALRARTLVPWVSPAWFSAAQLALMTSSQPVLNDPDIILSRNADAIQYSGPEALIGRKFGGVRGHRYHGIDELVTAGKIERLDVRSFAVAIEGLRVGRVDATLVPLSSFHYLVSSKMRNVYHLSPIPGEDPQRRILVPRERPDLLARLNDAIVAMPTDPAWSTLLSAYNLTPES